MARARRASRDRSGGGGGQAITVIVVLALLGGLAWFGWSQIQKSKRHSEIPTGLRVDVLNMQRAYRMKGEVPDPLPDTWRLNFQVPPFVRRAGESTVNPRAWIDVQLENGRFAAMSIAVWREAELTAPFEIICEESFAGNAEGKQLRELINQLAGKPDKSTIEGQTANFRLFAWKHRRHKGLKRSVVAVARRKSAEGMRMLQKARADWTLGIAAGSAAPTAPKTRFDVVLVSFARKDRDRVLAAVCELTGLGPAEGGTLIDSAPKAIKSSAGREEAEAWKRKIESAGARVEVK